MSRGKKDSKPRHLPLDPMITSGLPTTRQWSMLNNLSVNRNNEPWELWIVGVNEDGALDCTSQHLLRSSGDLRLIPVSRRPSRPFQTQARNIAAQLQPAV